MNVALRTSVFKSGGRLNLLDGNCQPEFQSITQMSRMERPHGHIEMHPPERDFCQVLVFPVKCLDNFTSQGDIL